jgi:hypothetical protein
MRILLVGLILLCPAIALGQRAPFPIPNPDPEVERQSFIVADGFEVNLFASEITPFPADSKGVKSVGIAKPILRNQPRSFRDRRLSVRFPLVTNAILSSLYAWYR